MQQFGVFDVAGKDHGFAQRLTVGQAQAVFHQVAQNGAVGVFVVDGFVDQFAVEVEGVGVDALIFELGDLLI